VLVSVVVITITPKPAPELKSSVQEAK